MKKRIDVEIYLLAIGQTLAWASIYYIFPAFLLKWEQDFGWSKADLTAAITIATLVSALFSPFAGRIIDRGHGPILLGSAAILGGLGLVLLSLVDQQWQFYAVWLLIGVAIAGCLYEPCFAIIDTIMIWYRATHSSASPAPPSAEEGPPYACSLETHSLSISNHWRRASEST